MRIALWWALRGSNPRPSPGKGDALPAELSARACGCRVTAGAAHHVTELYRQARRTTRLAPVKTVGPYRLALALGAHEHMSSARDRPSPRHRTLVGIVGETAAAPTRRSIARLVGSVERPHGPQGYASCRG